MSYEPPLDDDFAIGLDDECLECGLFIYECTCGELDELFDDEIYYDLDLP